MPALKYQVGDQLLTADELAKLGSESADLFYRLFFSRTMKQESAPFHLELDALLDDPRARLVHARMFRGSAKTSRLRMYTGRRIAYGLSRTILYVGASEAHASRSIKWLRRQIEINKVFSGVFQLKPGKKWDETQLEIISKVTGETCWVLGAGITGNIRGINFDDYRPDLIVLDDILTDENAATKEQREKVVDLVMGALRGSLVPPTEDPNAKMVFLQTPMHPEDASSRAEKDSAWTTLTVPIWNEAQESAWPVRYPAAWIQQEKSSYISQNKLSIWMKEFEMKLTTPEDRAFKPEWLRVIDIAPKQMMCVLSIDPVPPPSDRQLTSDLKDKDFEALVVIGRYQDTYIVPEYSFNKGHEPNWTVSEFFRLCFTYRPIKVIIEGVAYQRTLKWILEQEMKRRGVYFPIEAVTDGRKKYHKIVSSLSGLGSAGKLACLASHTELKSQFDSYPQTSHDDVLEAFAQGIARFANPVMEMGADEYMKVVVSNSNYKVPTLRGAP